jgi:hypothetical protein
MNDDPLYGPYGRHASTEARYLFAYLAQRGGCMRLKPAERHLRLEPAVLVTAITELVERYWITLVWRPAAPGTPEDEPRPYTDIDRLVATRFGRKKYRTTWPVV